MDLGAVVGSRHGRGRRRRVVMAGVAVGAMVGGTLTTLVPGAQVAGAVPAPVIGWIATMAGGGPVDGTPATNIAVVPTGIAADTTGNLYIVDVDALQVRKVDAAGLVSTVAGNGVVPAGGFAGDGGPATAASLMLPSAVAVDTSGNLYIADTGNLRVRKVSTGGIISTVAGNGSFGYSGDGGQATNARIGQPTGVAVDGSGNLFIISKNTSLVRKVTLGGVISTVAGTGSFGYSGDGGPATSAKIAYPSGIATDGLNNFYLTDTANSRVRMVTPGGVISTVVGTGVAGFTGDGGAATSAKIKQPTGVTADAGGNVTFADAGNGRVRQVAAGVITTVAGTGTAGFSGDGGAATGAQLANVGGVARRGSGGLVVADAGNIRVRQVTGGVIDTVAGNGTVRFSGDGGPATSAQFRLPSASAVSPSGDVYIVDAGNHRVRKVAPSGTVSTFAGNGTAGFSGDSGQAVDAQLNNPQGVAVSPGGTVFITDAGNNRVRKVTTDGVISTFAGDGTAGFVGDGGPATSAEFRELHGVAVDGFDDVFLADGVNNRVRKVTAAGVISSIPGAFSFPEGLAVNSAGDVFVADYGHQEVQKVTAAGTVSVVAGTGTGGFSGDGGPAGNAQLLEPSGVAVDGSGNLFIADTDNHRVRRVSPAGVIDTYAGVGTLGFSGDGGPAIPAQLDKPDGVAVDGSGNVLITDTQNHRIRKVSSGSLFHPVTPVRILDSRPFGPKVGPYATPWGAGATRDIDVGGVAGVPAGADAVVMNVTVVGSTASSFLSIWPAGQPQPTVSSLNFRVGSTIANQVTVKLGAAGKVSMYNLAGTVNVIADVAGYFDATSGDGFTSVTPQRVLDSRPGGPQVGPYSTPWGPGTVRDVSVGGAAGVPLDAEAVVLNVTAVTPTGSSFLSIWPAGEPQPTASSLNWTVGVTIPNAVTVKLGAAGRISIYNQSGTVNVIADVAGYYQAGTGRAFHPISPGRVLDSRSSGPQVGPYSTPWGAGVVRDIAVGGLVGVPVTADAVVANVTVTDTTAQSYLTIWPAGAARPTASSLNWTAGVTIPNAVTVKLGTAGKLSMYNLTGGVDVITDISGFYG